MASHKNLYSRTYGQAEVHGHSDKQFITLVLLFTSLSAAENFTVNLSQVHETNEGKVAWYGHGGHSYDPEDMPRENNFHYHNKVLTTTECLLSNFCRPSYCAAYWTAQPIFLFLDLVPEMPQLH
jgi:hypothetical protein